MQILSVDLDSSRTQLLSTPYSLRKDPICCPANHTTVTIIGLTFSESSNIEWREFGIVNLKCGTECSLFFWVRFAGPLIITTALHLSLTHSKSHCSYLAGLKASSKVPVNFLEITPLHRAATAVDADVAGISETFLPHSRLLLRPFAC